MKGELTNPVLHRPQGSGRLFFCFHNPTLYVQPATLFIELHVLKVVQMEGIALTFVVC